MRPNRPNSNDNLQYRRDRNTGQFNIARIAVALTVAVGLVVVALVLTNTYEFGSGPPPDESSESQGSGTASSSGSGASSDDKSDLLWPGDTDSLSINSGSGSGSGSDSDSGFDSGSGSDSGSGADSISSADSATGDDPLAKANSGSVPAGSTVLSGCMISGRVTDDWGSAMVNVRVFATTAEGTVFESITDKRGRYRLPDSTPDIVSVSIALAHTSDTGQSFAVMKGKDVITLSSPIDPAVSGCEINFDSWNVQDQMIASPIDTELWPDAASIYQYTRKAESLALSLGADLNSAPTLQIQAWCDDPAYGCDVASDGAYFIAENELDENSPPIIAMLPSRSSAQSPGVPDNREYHEYGHFFLSLQTGDEFELPAGDTNHGGYYENSSTRDSFVEGFAEFYSMMVARHIDGDDNSEIYTIGADYDLETDRLPWEAAGWWEEFTVAGLLLDLVDDDPDYAENPSSVTGVNILDVTTNVEPSGTIISGSVINASPLVVRNADVTIRYLNDAGEVIGTQVTRILPAVIAPTREGTFYAAPPAGLDVAQATATLGGIAKSDDDDVSIGLLRLIGIITDYERPNSDGAIGVSNVAELYDALTNGDDALTSGISGLAEIPLSQIDEIFINHGFYDDLNGDKRYDPNVDGQVGTSAHPVAQFGEVSYPAFTSRHDPGAFEGSFVKINTGDASVDAIIQISIPADGGSRSYAYIAPKNGNDNIELAIPPADQDAEVTIITAGNGYKPVIAFRVTADNFHEKVANGTISELQIATVELQPGTSFKVPTGKNSTIQFGAIIGGIVAVILVVLSLAAIRRQWGNA